MVRNIGYVDAKSSDVAYTWSQIDYLYWNSLIPGSNGLYNYEKATGYTLDRAHTGYIGNYDFAVSGNLNDRVLSRFNVRYEGCSLQGI